MVRIILDTDLAMGAPGSDVDDGFALALAHADPDISIEMITTVNGNTDVESATILTRSSRGVSGSTDPDRQGSRGRIHPSRDQALPRTPRGGPGRLAAATVARLRRCRDRPPRARQPG